MLSLIKTFGKGLLYTITLPITLLILLGYMVYGVFYFLFLTIKSIVLFFEGKTIYSELEEDVKAREILTGIKEEKIYVDTLDPIEEVIEEPKKEDFSSLNIPVYTFNNTDLLPKEEVKEEPTSTPIQEEPAQEEEDDFVFLEEPEEVIVEEEIVIEEESEPIEITSTPSKNILEDIDNYEHDDEGVSIVSFDEEEDY